MAKTKKDELSLTRSNFGLKGWIVIVLSFLSILLQSSIINDSLNVTIGAFAQTRGWNPAVLYMSSTITAWIAVAGAALWGFLSQKINVRFTWALSLLVAAAACFFWGRAASMPVYFVCLAVASVGGMAFAYIANLNVISNWFPKKKGLAMGWVTIGFPLSASVTTPLVSGLLGAGGLERVYMVYAIAAVVLAIAVVVFIRDYPEQAGAYPDNDRKFSKEENQRLLAEGLEYMKTSEWTAGKLFKTRRVWAIAFSLGVMELLSLGIMTNFMPRCLQIGMTEQQVIPMLAIAGLIACVGSVACGLLDAKVGPKKATIITFAIGIVAICLNITNILPLMYASLVFLGFMLGGAANYLVSLTNTIWGRFDFPMAYKVLKPMVAVVGAIGVSLVGVLGNTISYVVAYAVLGVLALVALIVIWRTDDSMLGRDITK